MTAEIDVSLDVSGMCCPVPLIQLAKSVKNLKTGQTLEISGNDPIFEASVRDFCQANGHSIIEVKTDGNRRVSILIKVEG